MLKDGTDSAFWHQFSRLPKWKQTFFLHEKMNLKIFFLQTLTLTAEKVTKWFDRNEDAVANVVDDDHNLFKTNNDEFVSIWPKTRNGSKNRRETDAQNCDARDDLHTFGNFLFVGNLMKIVYELIEVLFRTIFDTFTTE
jgi:hypothetical protein